ncbi:MAG: hypothetical protein Q8831_02610, partial ['Bonamia sp.' little leaf phytoplasma]|nr:hypothetical protein ['Bonamia sp.' little leaf phytoplasma]
DKDLVIETLTQDKTDLNNKITRQDQIIKTQKQTLEDKDLVIEDRDRTIVTLTETEEINLKQKKYLYNKINKISGQKQLMFSKKIKFFNLIKQYLKNFGLIKNQTWKLLFQQYSQIYFIIMLFTINILFYSLLIKNFKSY